MQSQLPPGFEALDPFVKSWAIHGATQRARRRLNSDEPERVAFFEAAKGLLAPALTFLDTKPLAQFDEKEQRLMDLMLTFAHVALAVEQQGSDEPFHAIGARHLTITRAPSDVCA